MSVIQIPNKNLSFSLPLEIGKSRVLVHGDKINLVAEIRLSNTDVHVRLFSGVLLYMSIFGWLFLDLFALCPNDILIVVTCLKFIWVL